MPLVNLVATLNLTAGTGEIAFVNPVARAVSPEPGAGDLKASGVPALVRLIDANDNVVGEQDVVVSVESCEDADADRTALIDAILAVGDDVVALELVVAGRVMDRFESGPAPSDLGEIRSTVGPPRMKLEWDSAEATDPKVTYTIQVSADGGNTWETIAIGRPTPDVRVDPERYPDADSVKVRVTATNGFRTTKAVESEIRFS